MTDLPRIKDQYAGVLEARLIGSARADRPSSIARRRTLVAIGTASTIAALPATTTAAVGVKLVGLVGAVTAAKWAGIGLAVGALTLGGVLQAPRLFGSAPHHVAARARTPTTSEAGSGTNDVVRSVEPEKVLEPAPEEASPPRQPAPNRHIAADDHAARRVETQVPAPAPVASSAPLELRLAEETALLDEAGRAMAASPARALALLDVYQQRFPRGDLAPEALVLRVEGLVRTSQSAAAESLARVYLARHGASLHAKRIRTLLGWREDD